MSKISTSNLTTAIRQLEGMSLSEKEQLCDEIYEAQPILLASVLSLSRMEQELTQIEVVLEILMVIHLAVKEAGIGLAAITEQDQEKALQRLTATVKFSEGMPAHLKYESVGQYEVFQSEPELMAYTIAKLQKSGILDDIREITKYLLLVALTIVACIAQAKAWCRQAKGG